MKEYLVIVNLAHSQKVYSLDRFFSSLRIRAAEKLGYKISFDYSNKGLVNLKKRNFDSSICTKDCFAPSGKYKFKSIRVHNSGDF